MKNSKKRADKMKCRALINVEYMGMQREGFSVTEICAGSEEIKDYIMSADAAA